MADGSWNQASFMAGGLIGVAITAVIVLVTREPTTLLLGVASTSAAVSLLLAIAIIRHTTTTWSTLWFVLGVIIAPSVIYPVFRFFGQAAPPLTARVELPGFSLQVIGEETGGFETEYDFGWVRHYDKYSELSATVLWAAGGLADVSSEEEAADWVRSFEYEDRITVSARETPLTWPDLETRSYRIYFEMRRGDLTFLACGGRLVAVITEGGVRSKAERAQQHQVASFACAPIAEEETGVGRPPPVEVTPPEEWVARTDVDPLWAVWSTESASMMFMYFHRGHENLGDMHRMVTDGIGHWGTVAEVGSERVGDLDVWRGTLTDDTGVDQVYAFSVTCGRRPLLAILFGRDGVDEARAAFLAARCE